MTVWVLAVFREVRENSGIHGGTNARHGFHMAPRRPVGTSPLPATQAATSANTISGPHLAKRRTEHGSGLGKTRWYVERTLAWFKRYGKIRIRTEKRAENAEALVKLAACVPLTISWTRLLLYWARPPGRMGWQSAVLRQVCASSVCDHLVILQFG